jgi:2-dehydropantoate 2-reductase
VSDRLRIGIVGAGAIGCFVGGKLVRAGGCEVVFVGRPRLRDEIAAHGLTVQDLGGAAEHLPAAQIRFDTDLAAVAACDAILCCVKSGQTRETARALAAVIRPDAIVASLQNGIGNAEVLREELPGRTVLPGVVSFNVVPKPGAVFHQTTSGPLMFGAGDDPRARALTGALAAAGLEVEVRAELAPDQWTKLIVNLNNAISALSGAPTRELLLSPGYRKVIAAVVAEAVAVLRAAKIRPARLRGVPIGFMPAVMRLPTPLVRLVTGSQIKVDPQARSSMWEDLQRGRATEVEYLNGEIVRLAERAGVDAPLNRRIVSLVHEAEAAASGSPQLSAERLWDRLTRSDR